LVARDKPRRKWLLIAGAAVSFLVLKVLVQAFILDLFRLPAGSMLPTITVKDQFFVKMFSYRFGREPERGDIVMFRSPVDEAILLKRVIAIPGDTVELKGTEVRINGQPLARGGRKPYSYVDVTGAEGGRPESKNVHLMREKTFDGRREYSVIYKRDHLREERAGEMRPFKIEPGHYFVLGDNRDNSMDSRLFGAVPHDDMIGEASVFWRPAEKMFDPVE
jgi:signal peptidase I